MKDTVHSMKRFAITQPASLLAALTLATPVSAEPPGPEKSGYHLFNPTPAELMRELSTDRPDQTESAYTVDAGHFQIEADLLNFSRDRDAAAVSEDLRSPVLNLKVGLLNAVDLQVILEPFVHVRSRDLATGNVAEDSGFGDVTTRIKINLWGNDGGTTALALMPFAKWPTADSALGNGSVEGGLIVPLAVALPGEFGLGLMTEVDFLRDQVGGGHHAEFVNSITVSRDLFGPVGAYVEFFTVVSTENGSEWQGYFDLGLTFGFTDNFQLDAGINLGVTDSAPDWNPFVGFSWRY